ncbi:MAG: thiol reductant ABC exporter subunit CydD [Eggerthellaceae bacterium]|nr:thiol reductant ABC exporter subunit CydD [Eggerthellaceae bacterium]
MLALLLVFGVADATLVLVQAFSLAQAVVAVWQVAPFSAAGAFAIIVHGSLLPEADALAGACLCAAVFLAAFLLRRGLALLRAARMDRFARETTADLRKQLLEATYALGPDHVAKQGSGACTGQLIEGMDAIRAYIGILFPKVADLMAVPTVLTLALFFTDWISGIIALVILPCIIFFMQMLGTHAKARAERQYALYGRLSNHFIDTLRGLATLQAFGRARPYANQVFNASEQARESTMATLRTAFLSSLVLDLFRTFGLAAVAIMFGFRLMDGAVALLPALAVLIILPEYFAAVRRFASDFHANLDGRTNLAAVLEVLGEAKALEARRAALGNVPIAPWGPDSTLEMRGIGFSYDGNEALQDISFAVHGPAKVGIIGESGAGKTTLVRLLAGFADATSGTFVVDGRETPTLAHPDWLAQVMYIPQNPYLFSATLHENIAFYTPDAGDEAVLRAVRAAGLAELVESLPDGLDTPIGRGGRTLSGGQAQRVALARAFLDERRRVLIFDEPTAHLDIETELALKEEMLPLMEGRLVFFATHRLHWLEDMDQVIDLANGCSDCRAAGQAASREPFQEEAPHA